MENDIRILFHDNKTIVEINKGNVIGKNVFRGRLIIRCNKDNKKYLYDIIDIKKET